MLSGWTKASTTGQKSLFRAEWSEEVQQTREHIIDEKWRGLGIYTHRSLKIAGCQ